MKSCNIPREVVRLLGAFSIIGLVGLLFLTWQDKAVPEGMLTLIAGTSGALGAILSSTRNVNEIQPVEVTNTAKDPVPTTDEGTGR